MTAGAFYLRRRQMRRFFKFSHGAAAVFAALCILLSFTAVQAAEKGEVARTIQNIDRYSKGLKIGMSFSESTALLGKPNEKKNIPGDKSADHAYFATWLLKGYSLDAQFSGDNRLVSYGIHWFGKAGTAPEFKEVFAGNFTEENKLGTRTAKLEGTDTVISWTKTPLPGSDKVIDVLTVGKK